jgi:hypothetical protein
VGAGGADDGGGHQTKVQEAAIRQVHQTICGEVGPAIAALVEQVGTETPAWAALNSLLGKLSVSKATLEDACAPQHADHYNIGEGGHDVWEEQSVWSESHDLRGQTWGGEREGCDDGDGGDWGPRHGQGAWGCATDDCDDGLDQSMGTGDWWDAPARRWGGDGTRWQPSGHSKWRRASWADQSEEEPRGADEEDGPPAAARRRLEATPAGRDGDAARDGAASAAAAVQDAEAQKRLHGERLNHIIAAAVDAGVTPLTQQGEDLRLLDPHQLDAWVAENLSGAQRG